MSLRIRQLAELVRRGLIPADIGTDHGLLPILLVEQGIVQKAYACDVAEGPLSQARANIAAHGCQDQIVPVLSDGFEQVPSDADCAVIAGMGWFTACRILEEADGRLHAMKQIIVQVNQDVSCLRTWICEHGYTIHSELTVMERSLYYTIVEFSCRKHSPYSEREILCGPLDAIRDSDAFQNQVAHELNRLRFVNERRGGDSQIQKQIALWEESSVLLKRRQNC